MSNTKAPSFQFYASDFLTDTAEFTDQEKGVYIRLLCLQWVNGSISATPERLGLPNLNVWDQIKDKFDQGEDGRLRNRRLEKVRQEQQEYREKQQKAGVKGAAKRWRNDSTPNGDPISTPNGQKMALQSSSSSSSFTSVSNSKKGAKNKFSPFMEELKEIYLDWFNTKNDISYSWAAKDNKAIGSLVAKIKKAHKDKEGAAPGAEQVKNTFAFFLKNLPQWFQDKNCDVGTLNGHYNSIINQIINSNGTKKSATNEILADIESRSASK